MSIRINKARKRRKPSERELLRRSAQCKISRVRNQKKPTDIEKKMQEEAYRIQNKLRGLTD